MDGVGVPVEGEYAPGHAAYVARAIELGGPARLLPIQAAALRAICGGLTEEAALFRYAPGKWSIKQVLGHIADAERVFSYRALRIGRGDATPLTSFDENAYADAGAFDERPVEDLLRDFEGVRASTTRLLDSFGPDAWTRRGDIAGQAVTLRGVAYVIAGHVEHHAHLLRERYSLAG